MALFSFSTPTDKEILLDLKKESQSIQFIGSGCFSQKIERVKFSRKFKFINGHEEDVKKVVYIKKGRNWKLLEIVSLNDNE